MNTEPVIHHHNLQQYDSVDLLKSSPLKTYLEPIGRSFSITTEE